MKMADGGFRPAYNFQFSTATDSQVIVGVDVEMTGSDAGQMVPMVEQVKGRYETVPGEVLVDGGFAQHDQIETASGPALGCTVYAPVPKPKDPQVDRHAPKPGDSPAVAAWRSGWGRSRPRRSTRNGHRRPNASMRRRGVVGCFGFWSVAWPRSRRLPCGTPWPTTCSERRPCARGGGSNVRGGTYQGEKAHTTPMRTSPSGSREVRA